MNNPWKAGDKSDDEVDRADAAIAHMALMEVTRAIHKTSRPAFTLLLIASALIGQSKLSDQGWAKLREMAEDFQKKFP